MWWFVQLFRRVGFDPEGQPSALSGILLAALREMSLRYEKYTPMAAETCGREMGGTCAVNARRRLNSLLFMNSYLNHHISK